MRKIGKITLYDETWFIFTGVYPAGPQNFVSIGTEDCEDEFDVITRYVPGISIEKDQCLVPTYSHVSEYRMDLLATGLFKYVKTITAGMVMFEVWQILASGEEMKEKEFGFDVTLIYSPTLHIKCLASTREEAIEKLERWIETKESGVKGRLIEGYGNLNSLDDLSQKMLANPDWCDFGENLSGLEIVPFEYDEEAREWPRENTISRDWGIKKLEFLGGND